LKMKKYKPVRKHFLIKTIWKLKVSKIQSLLSILDMDM
jgi:hypothetical protein